MYVWLCVSSFVLRLLGGGTSKKHRMYRSTQISAAKHMTNQQNSRSNFTWSLSSSFFLDLVLLWANPVVFFHCCKSGNPCDIRIHDILRNDSVMCHEKFFLFFPFVRQQADFFTSTQKGGPYTRCWYSARCLFFATRILSRRFYG